MRRLLPLLLLAACAAPADAPPTRDYVLVLLRRGDAAASLSDERRQEIQAAHLANIGRLAGEGKIVIAGPFGQDLPDPTLRGFFIFDVPSIAQAEQLTRTDPAVAAGVLVLEAHTLATAADLAALMRRDLAARETRLAAGETSMAAGMRNYVVALSPDASRAGPLLESDARTVLAARFGGDWDGRGFWVLDVRDVATALQVLDSLGDRPGPIELYPWFGSEGIAELRAR